MKLRMIKSAVVEIKKSRLDEVWDLHLKKWDEINAESINYNVNGSADVTTGDGDVIYDIPADSFEVVATVGLEPTL